VMLVGVGYVAVVAFFAHAPLPLTRRFDARMAEADNDQGVEYKVQKRERLWWDQFVEEDGEETGGQRHYVLREKGTERPGSSSYNKFYPEEGHFACAGCAAPLYSAGSKFDSGCGWPAFDKIVQGAVVTKTDTSLGMSRVEIMCSNCGGHLGHVFEGENFTPTNERHCVNGISLRYVKEPLPESDTEAKVLPERTVQSERSRILEELMGGGES